MCGACQWSTRGLAHFRRNPYARSARPWCAGRSSPRTPPRNEARGRTRWPPRSPACPGGWDICSDLERGGRYRYGTRMAPTARELLAEAAAGGEDLETVARAVLERLAQLTRLSSTHLAETKLKDDEQLILFSYNSSLIFPIPQSVTPPCPHPPS